MTGARIRSATAKHGARARAESTCSLLAQLCCPQSKIYRQYERIRENFGGKELKECRRWREIGVSLAKRQLPLEARARFKGLLPSLISSFPDSSKSMNAKTLAQLSLLPRPSSLHIIILFSSKSEAIILSSFAKRPTTLTINVFL